jgi:flavin reductase (DIM6/NTAB) family NADH-FMN oxidoreductase RutF
MLTYDFRELPIPQAYKLMTLAVAPRPIAFVSTLSPDGVGNLAPFSYFNIGGAHPPSCVICPINTRNEALKDTVRNIEATGEYVINAVTRGIAEQASQCSWAYPYGVDEFDAVGLTRAPSTLVKPPRVAESPLAIECRLHQIVRHGAGALASNYIIGEMLLMHVAEEATTDGLPDNAKLDLVGRLGADWYCTTRPDSLFPLPRPVGP